MNETVSLRPLPLRWVRLALAYFLVAVLMGVAMAASHDHRLKGVHVHLNLLGWVSMAVFAWLYQQFPRAAASRAAALHFWLYNLSLPLSMGGLAAVLLGHAAFGPVVAIGSLATCAAVVVFVATLMRATFSPAPAAAAPATLAVSRA